MPEQKEIVINTSPLLALIAAWGMLDPLKSLYRKIWVPYEVGAEIEQGGSSGFGVSEFRSAGFLARLESPLTISPCLENSLDRGEAAVIQAAIDRNIRTVCIDERFY
jgi:predicted nucleic acid-binding protein